jgi:hypothetical protein
MSTQTGQTYLDGGNGLGNGLLSAAPSNTNIYLTFSGINLYRYYTGFVNNTSLNTGPVTLIADNFNNNSYAGIAYSTSNTNIINMFTCNVSNCNKNGYNTSSGYGLSFLYSTTKGIYTIINANSNWLSGFTAGAINLGNAVSYSNTINITNANRNTNAGIFTAGAVSNTISVTNLLYNSPSLAYGQLHVDAFTVYTVPMSAGTPGCEGHDNIITVGNVSTITSTSPGITLGNGANNNKIFITGVFTGFTSTANPCIAAFYSGTNYIISTGSVLGSGQYMATILGSSILYFNTADTILSPIGRAAGAGGQVIIKNIYGIQNQNYTFPTSWGLT